MIIAYTINFLILILLCSWPILSVMALLNLRRLQLRGIEASLWAIIIVFAPILGAWAFFIINQRRADPR